MLPVCGRGRSCLWSGETGHGGCAWAFLAHGHVTWTALTYTGMPLLGTGHRLPCNTCLKCCYAHTGGLGPPQLCIDAVAGVLLVPLSAKQVRRAEFGHRPSSLNAPRFALLVPPISVSIPILAAVPAAVPVAAVPAPLLLVAAAALALPAAVTSPGLLTAAWNLSPGLVCAFCRPNC